MILKAHTGSDAYLLWSTDTSSPTHIGSRDDMLSLLTGEGAGPITAAEIMATVDETGTSDPRGKCGWGAGTVDVAGYDPERGKFAAAPRPLPRRSLTGIVEAVAAGDPDMAATVTMIGSTTR